MPLLVDSIPIDPPNGSPPPPPGQLLPDVQLAEDSDLDTPRPNGISTNLSSSLENSLPNGHVNGHASLDDNMEIDSPQPIASSTPMVLEDVSVSVIEMNGIASDYQMQEPPAKRARRLSDAEQASLAHVSSSVCVLQLVGVLT